MFQPVDRYGFVTYWRAGSDPTVLPEYRVPSDSSKARDIESIPLPELLSAINEAAESYGSFDRETAPKVIASMFGFSRSGDKIKAVTDSVLDIAVMEGLLKEDCGRFVRPRSDQNRGDAWSHPRDSNPRSPVYKTGALTGLG